MAIISYAQNFEDVMLARALQHVENGFYIDLGAQDPVIDSVSLAFHERGWKGIHVEPTPHYAQLLREQRPGDTVIEAAVANAVDLLTFFEIPGTGISTGDRKIAEQHRVRGFEPREITVPCVRLSSVFKTCAKQVIHWMKVDVEGFEWSAIASWGKAPARPWIVVVESTLPLTQIESHQRWEPLLLKRGYSAVYFDGLNRYYVSQEKPELKQAFSVPPNVFDKFSISGTASTSIHHHLGARHAAEIMEVSAKVQRADSVAENLRRALEERESGYGELERDRLLQLNARNAEIFDLERSRAAREEKFAADNETQAQQKEELLRQLVATEQAASKKMLDWHVNAEREREQLHHCYSAREAEVSAQLSAIHGEYAERIATVRREVDAERLKLASLHQLEATDLRRTLTTREREFGEQILSFQAEAARTQSNRDSEYANRIVELSSNHANELAAVHRGSENRQKFLQEQIEFAQQSCDELRGREQELQSRSDSLYNLFGNLEQTAQRLRSEMSAIKTSLSWRLTLPVRKATAYFFPSHAIASAARQDLIAPLFQVGSNNHALENANSSLHMSISSKVIMQSTPNTTVFNGALDDSVTKGLLALDNHDFLKGAYQVVFGRNIDPEGCAHYLGQLQNGSSRLSVLAQLRLSSEGMARAQKCSQVDVELAVATRAKAAATTFEELVAFQGTEFIFAAYLTMFSRDPDPAGMKDCIRRLGAGASKSEMLSHMQKSAEWQSRMTNIKGIVEAARRYGASKNASPANLAAMPDTQVAQPFCGTPTIQDLMKCNEEEFLQHVFMLILGRAPDPHAFGTYLNYLAAGMPRLQVLEAIEGSREAKNRAWLVAKIERATRQHRVAKIPLVGPFVRALVYEGESYEGEGLDGESREVRALQFDHAVSMQRLDQIELHLQGASSVCTVRFERIERQLAAMDDFTQHFAELKELVATLQRLTNQQSQQMMNAVQGRLSEIAGSSSLGEAYEPEGLTKLPAGAREIYVKLKEASAHHMSRTF